MADGGGTGGLQDCARLLEQIMTGLWSFVSLNQVSAASIDLAHDGAARCWVVKTGEDCNDARDITSRSWGNWRSDSNVSRRLVAPRRRTLGPCAEFEFRVRSLASSSWAGMGRPPSRLVLLGRNRGRMGLCCYGVAKHPFKDQHSWVPITGHGPGAGRPVATAWPRPARARQAASRSA